MNPKHVRAALQRIPLKRVYQALNRRYFGGKLPAATIRWERCAGYFGRCWSNANGICEKGRGGRWYNRGTVLIVLNPAMISKQPRFFVPVLLHEMIHGFLGAVMRQPRERHGPEFQFQVERIRRVGGTVSHRGQLLKPN